MHDGYMIAKLGWLTLPEAAAAAEGGPNIQFYLDAIPRHRAYFYNLVKFWQDNGLLKHRLIENEADLTDETAIRRGDLTDEGWSLFQAKDGYVKWTRMTDRGGDPSDTRILAKALARIRAEAR